MEKSEEFQAVAEKDVINNDDLGRQQIKGAHSSGSKNLKWQSNHKFNRENQGKKPPRKPAGITFSLGLQKGCTS